MVDDGSACKLPGHAPNDGGYLPLLLETHQGDVVGITLLEVSVEVPPANSQALRRIADEVGRRLGA